jgi:hypothetical protein
MIVVSSKLNMLERIQKFARNEKSLLIQMRNLYVHYKKFPSGKNYAMPVDGDFCMS